MPMTHSDLSNRLKIAGSSIRNTFEGMHVYVVEDESGVLFFRDQLGHL